MLVPPGKPALLTAPADQHKQQGHIVQGFPYGLFNLFRSTSFWHHP